MKNRIIEEAQKIGIDLIGFTDERAFLEVKPILERRMDKGLLSPFLQLDLEKNVSPTSVWADTKTIIGVGVAYQSKLDVFQSQDCTGNIARVGWGRDYHGVIMDKMDLLMKRIVMGYPQLKYKAYVDHAPLLDRAIAQRCGIGFYGKNGFIINPTYGSYIFLGHILINVSLEESMNTHLSSCATCNICVGECPTGALQGGYQFNANKCISYLTQKKELLNRRERKSLGRNLYGCDICQEVCPINKTAKLTSEVDFIANIDVVVPKLKEIINLDNATFNKIYKSTAVGWRGKKNLQKNAIIICGNSICEDNFKLLKQTIQDKRWDIRLYSMFSLLEYGEKGKNIVDEKLRLEDEEMIQKYHQFRS